MTWLFVFVFDFDFDAECFLQMKNPNSARPTQYPYNLVFNYIVWIWVNGSSCLNVLLNIMRCPFCKTPNYAVEYRGVKTKEEKGMEQVVR